MAHYEIDEAKMRVAAMLGPSFSLYSADEIAELEAAFRTDDPEELQRINDKWADRPAIEHAEPPQPRLPRLQTPHALRIPAAVREASIRRGYG